MKISKKALLTTGSFFSVAALGLMFVSGAWDNLFSNPDKELEINPSNAIQHFQNVKMIATGNNDNANATISKNGSGTIRIATDDNFVISTREIINDPCDWNGDEIITTGDLQSFNLCIVFGSCTDNKYDLNNDGIVTVADVMICTNHALNQNNKITQGVKGSSILGGFANRIKKGIYETILGGSFNAINTGDSNSILGGKYNTIENGTNSVIFGGNNNKITGARGENSAIIGSNGNTINISDATIVGNNNTVDGQYSIAMGKKAKVSGKNSFLWSDGRNSELSKNNVFAIIGDNGMVVNSTEAHDIAKLSISGSLVVFDDKNAPECTDETKGVLKVITGDNYNNEQECFCSCDGSGRNALHEGTRCTALCAYGTGLEAECGEVKINCGDNPYSYTGDELSGACAKGELVGGTGAFFVTTNKDGNTLTDYINRSCQVTDGHVSQCYQKLNESCPNINTGYECLGSYENVTGHIIINEEVPTDSASFWTYDPDLKGPCTYKCDQYGEWDPIEEKCTFHSCTGELSEGAQLNDEMVLPMDDNTEYFYDETSTGACAYTCSLESGYRYDPITDKCVPAGCDIAVTEVKDLEVFILSNTGNISHYTMMDRNLGATETFNQDDTSPNEESYGCYFQWGNIHPFNKDRSGSLNTRESLTNTTDYGPNKTNGYYSNPKYYCVSGSADIMYPRDGSGIPIATRFWGGGFTSNGTSYRDGRGTDGTDIDRQGPCPEGYHIPRGSEMESILNEWKDVSEYPTDTGFSDITLQKSKEFASDLLLPFAGYGGFSCSGARTVGLGRRGSYAIGDYYKLKNQLHVGISTAGNGAYLFLNGPAYGYSMRCVKNDISANQKITIHANGGSTAIITIDWETPENGKIITLENPIKTGYSFLGWYLDSTFNTSINEGDDIANNSHLYAKWEYKDCDMEQTVTQDLELFIISSTGEISHYTMMDRNLGAFEVYNQKGESAQNARSYGCHFQWGNNNGFTLGTPSTRYGINPTSYSPSTYSNNKIYCKNRDGSTGDVSELDEDDLNEGGNILGSQYTPINYHLWGGGYILYNRVFRTGYGSDGSDVDRRGPCPEGYHVPKGIEMDDFVNNWNDASSSRGAIGKNFASDLLMPFGRYIEVFCGEQNRFKVGGGIWLSDHIYKNYGGAGGGHYFNHIGKFTDNSAITFSRNGLAHGFPVRCVKNDFSANQKITIHANGGTGAVIGIDWESEGNGKITALSTPSKNGIQFLGWYTDSSFATDSKVTTGDYISNGGDLYAKWDECRIEDTAIQDLDIYILGSTGNTSHYVMMDRNLGATEVYNQDYGSSNQTSFGCYFQWGNNYPFHKTNIAKTQVQANVNGYGPSNYYSHGLLFCNTDDQPNNRFSSEGSDWKDLRGGITNTEISKKGPCPEGYHIPHNTEIQKLINEWKSATTITGGRQLANDMLTPFAGGISPRCNNGYANDNKAASFWMANAGSSADNICHLSLGNFTNGEVVSCRTNSAVHAFAVRCVKNDMDTAPQKITIHANGGTGAVISIDWETAENGKIISISEPRKNGTEFQGWYLDEGFTNPVGGYISNGSHLYAKWNECNISDTQIQDLEVFFIGSTGDISHYTLMDRNLGATEAFNQNISSPNKSSFGCYFQRGNNYPFNIGRSSSQTFRETLSDTKNYGPITGYYHNSNHFCNVSGDPTTMYPVDGSGYPFATWLWGGGMILNDGVTYRYDTNPPRGSWGTDGSDIDRQGPCPEGYHIPRGVEMNSIMQEWKDISDYPSGTGALALQKSKDFASNLLLPFAGWNSSFCGYGHSGGGRLGKYLISDYYKVKNHLHIGESDAGNGLYFFMNGPAYGYSMRCVKNNISANEKITIHANGGTKAVISIDWETEGSGKIITLGQPTKSGYIFSGWYSDEGFTNKVETGNYVSNNSQLYAKWLRDQEFKDLELYFLKDNGNITHYTMMDRNMGATEIYNQNYDSPNEASYGYYYQWGNNWGFEDGATVTVTSTQVDASGYGPGNWYKSSLFFRGTSSDWSSVANNNLWGGSGDVYGNNRETGNPRIERQGPCPEGYHVPSEGERRQVSWTNRNNASTVTVNKGRQFASDLLLPFAGSARTISYNSTFIIEVGAKGSQGYYWTSSDGSSSDQYSMIFSVFSDRREAGSAGPRTYTFAVRCFKDSDNPQTLTIHPNGGKKAVIAVDDGIITALGEPIKDGATFEGWYSNSGLTNPVQVGDDAPSDLYAKWSEDQEFEDLELYFLKDDGNIIHYTMMDRNMGAAETYNQNFDNPNTESFGNHYQWGNNWGFKPCIALGSQCGTFPGGESYTTNERVQKSEWSLNTKSRYVSNVYREINSSPFNWMADADAVANDESTDMWGGKGDTKTSNGAGTVSDRQGPCPDEYYVPSTLNWGNIIGSWKKSTPDTKDGIKMASDLLLPVAGARDYQSKYVQNQGSFGRYWSSSLRTDENSRAFSLRFASGDILPQQPLNISRGASVRCIKGVTNPQTITIHANGGIKAVIAIDGGKITALGEPSKSGYKFEGWYLDTGFNNPINTGDYISDGSHLYAKRNETVVQDLDVYILGETGDISRYMMMDRNLGATEIYNQNYSSPNKASYGYYYQWGNNYGFPTEGSVTTSSTQVDASGYGPSNYYASSTFITRDAASMDWSSVRNDNLWGGESSVVSDKQGPCPDGYHVPNNTDWQNIYYNWTKYRNRPRQLASDLLLPPAGARMPSSSDVIDRVTGSRGGFYWASTARGVYDADVFNFDGSLYYPNVVDVRSFGFSVRCFKNTIDTEPITIHANGGTGAVIAIDWETEGSGKIMTIGTPSKNRAEFLGWYTDEGLTNPVNTGDYITSNSHLYAKRNETIVQDLDIYMLGETGDISRYVMMDRNLGATEVYNQKSGRPNRASFGYYYQWGNNYGFPNVGDVTTSAIKVDASGYGPDNYYNSSVFITGYEWDNAHNQNLWGDITNTNQARQGPCPEGYYVPSGYDRIDMHRNRENVHRRLITLGTGYTYVNSNGGQWASDFLMPYADLRNQLSVIKTSLPDGCAGLYWTSVKEGTSSNAYGFCSSAPFLVIERYNSTYGFPVRCFKNTIDTEPITIHANGGTKALISIDWETEGSGKIMTLGQPTKSGYIFSGWYLDEGFTNKVETGNYVSNNSQLYAKWIEATAILLPGTEFNLALRYLSQGPYPTQGDTRVKQILRSENKPQSGEILQTISIEGSNVPVVAWSERDGDNSTIYFYTEAEKIYMNPDSSQMFYPFEGLENVDLSHFDTSIVTDMSSMFQGCRHITELDVSHFDTSNVTNMSHMFSQMFSGEHIIGLDSFDTSKVVNMAAMFYGDRELTELNISGWDTSNVEFMSSMFESCNGLTKLDVSNWNTSKVTNMSNMFTSCNSLTGLDVSNWNTSNVTKMYGMFQQCSNLTELDLSNFDTSKVTDMHDMFSSCRNLTNLDVSNWDTSKVTDMYYMFQGLGLTRLDLSSFDTSNVRNMAYMFYCSSNLRTIYASSGFVTTNVTQDQKMFAYSSSSSCYPRNLVGGNGTRFDISHNDKSYAKIDKPGQTGYFTELLYTTLLPGNDFNSEIIRLAGSVSNITQIIYTGNMPAGTNTGIVSVDGFEPVIAGYKDGKIYLTTDAVKIFLNEDSSAMFSGLSNVTKIDTTNRNTSNVTDMRFMFYKCNNLTGLDVSNWKTSNVTSMRNMFRECNSLTELDVSHWKTSNVTDMGYMFNKCYNLESLDVSHWDTSNVTDMKAIFQNCNNIKELDVSHWDTSNVTNMSAMFNKCYDLKSLDISDWDTSNVTDMGAMFQHCESLTNLDVSSWDTSNVTDMQYMFFNCSNLTGLDVSNLNTSSVTNMASMFCNCINLTGLDVSNWDTSNVTDMQLMFGGGPDITMNLEYLDVSNWDTHNVTNMEAMFQNCSNLTSLDVSNWNTSNVTYMDHMFCRCNNLRELDVSNWNTSNVTDMKFMFDRCYNLENLDVSNFDTSNVTNMRAMFQNCNKLTDLDLSIWNTNKVINTEYMFADCNNLTTIYASTGFVTTAVTNSDSMFYNDTKLVGGNGTRYTSSHIDKEYAKIDKPGQSGYFTELTYATLLPGEQFNQTIKRLAGQSSATHSTTNTTITQILYTGSMPAGATTGLVSTQGSIPVIAGYLNGTIYLTTEADRIYLNSDSSYMFYDMKGLTKVDFSGWNTSDVTRMSYMFYGCNSLTELDLSNWDTSNVTTVAGLFEYCSSLTGLDLSTWNTSKMTSMFSMFYNCTGMQTLNMSGWDFSHLPSGRGIYDELYFRNLTNLRSFNLSNAKFSGNMYDAFYNMTNLREINLDGADVSNVVGMNHMFWNCTNLETVSMSGWNTSNVTSMDSMFDGCTRLTGLDLSSWNTSNVTNMLGMFKNCKNLTTIYANTGFITNQVATSTSMFYNDKKLVGGNGTIYDESNTNKTYARIDKPGQKGYFTEK